MSFIPGADGSKSIFKDGIQVDHISENTLGHGIVFNNSVGITPTAMTDAHATALGLKQYLADKSGGANDIAYYGGNKATISGTSLSSISRAILIPYQMQDGSWRLKGNIAAVYSSPVNPALLSVTGILSKPNGGTVDRQSFHGSDNSTGNAPSNIFIDGSSNTFRLNFVSTTSQITMGFDIELNSKPTWAY